jgi:hypothetical protein
MSLIPANPRPAIAGIDCLVLILHLSLPQIHIAIYDWDIMWKSNLLGSMSLIIDAEEQNGAAWHMLDSTGQVRNRGC